jgi:putative tryptophan/tyrosine transport system substrate-binding protein
MRRIGLAVILVLSLTLAPLAAVGQPAKTARIGWLSFYPAPTAPIPELEAFRQGLRNLGYIEGRNLYIEYRWAAASQSQLPALAADLVRLKVDLIVVGGHTPAILAAKRATSTIPIVFPVSGDPVGTGIVASLAHPGGNVTGLSFIAPEVGGKRLQLLKEAVPMVSNVGVLWNADNPSKELEWGETQAAGRALRLSLQSLEVRGLNEFEDAFARATKQGVGALVVLPDTLTLIYQSRLVDLAGKSRLPAMYGIRDFVDAGGLMSYGPDLVDLYRRAAGYVDKILKGAKPGDLPVEQPTKFELIVNLKTAKALGLTIPQTLLLQADRVIQ